MKIFFASIALLVTLSAHCQSFVANQDSLVFQTTTELERDSADIFILNQTTNDVTIDSVYLPEVYNHNPFSVKFKNGRTVNSNDSLALTFFFQPQQNITFKQDPLILFSNGESMVIKLQAQGEFSNSYYASTQNKAEDALKTALKARLSNPYYSLSYNTARDNMYASIDNVGGDVECVYTGRKATFNTRAGANSNNINCEHTFPQSKFNSSQPMQGDIHHLFPCDASANSVRSNHPFGNIQGNPSWSVGGSKYLNSVFEPRQEHKGDAARAMIYFVVRHQDFTNFFAPQEQTLRQWHLENLPTQKSRDRNDAIENVQKNRNPFVDYPQFIYRISKLSGISTEPTNYELLIDQSPIFINEVEASTGKKMLQKAITNFGNTPITISNFQFSAGNHQIINLPVNNEIIINPSESFVLEIEIEPTSQVLASTDLTFQTTDLNTQNASINLSWASILSVEKQSQNHGIQVFPNPSNGTFNIKSTNEIQNITLYNNLFQVVDFELIKSGQLNCRITLNSAKGTYFLKVANQYNSEVIKIVNW